jgi:hypothetical protein
MESLFTVRNVNYSYKKSPYGLSAIWGRNVTPMDYVHFCHNLQDRLKNNPAHILVDLGQTMVDGHECHEFQDLKHSWNKAKRIVTPIQSEMILVEPVSFNNKLYPEPYLEPHFEPGGELNVSVSSDKPDVISVTGQIHIVHGTTHRDYLEKAIETAEKRIFDGIRIR